MKKTIAAEFWLTALGAVAAAWAAYTQLDSVLSASANAALVGTTAGAALASLAALSSMLVCISSNRGGHFEVVTFSWTR